MNKEDLIYDLIVNNQKENNKRFDKIEKDIRELLGFKNHAIGMAVVIGTVFASVYECIKTFFIK